ncbi:MAG: flagellar biosynthetic protein FliR [Candidatus Hydrogenedentota bacterium]
MMTHSAVAFLETHVIPYLHIFVRVSGIFMLTPIFSIQETPITVKGWLSAGLALVLYPVISPFLAVGEAFDSILLLRLADDFLIGLLIGLFILVYYTALLMAGEFYSLQIGFGIINVIDPLSETSIPILGQLKSLFALVVFTIMDGHHMVIEAIVYSFRVLPELALASSKPLTMGLLTAIHEMFVIAFQIGAPVMGTMFLIELVMGIMSKVAPQMNVMVVGFQIKIVAGMFLIILILPTVMVMSQNLFLRAFMMVHGVLAHL